MTIEQTPNSPNEPRQEPSASRTGADFFAYTNGLEHPVIGMESEFSLTINGQEKTPEELWRHPSDFINVPLLHRATRASHVPTGGALYFDRGVLELVTPVIEIAPGCTARMVRSMWEQIGFLHTQLTRWGEETGQRVRLKAFSSHFNISYELSRDERNKDRTIQKLALLLAYILPVPVMVVAANRRSTGVGVRPRRDRIEITLDFTPDPGLMLATAALIVGIVRDVIAWPSYRLDVLDSLPIEYPADVDPGKHTTRKGWIVKDYHFARSPFTTDIDAAVWRVRSGELRSLREMAWRTATFFRKSIRKVADPFSTRLLFSVLEGTTPSLLELGDRPVAYDDIGRKIRWGTVLPELSNYATELAGGTPMTDGLDAHIATREARRNEPREGAASEPDEEPETERTFPRIRTRPVPELIARAHPARRAADLHERMPPPWSAAESERRRDAGESGQERRRGERRKAAAVFNDASLERSSYENVFIRLSRGERLRIDGRLFKPAAMHGWYEAELEDEATGERRRIGIDALSAHPEVWEGA